MTQIFHIGLYQILYLNFSRNIYFNNSTSKQSQNWVLKSLNMLQKIYLLVMKIIGLHIFKDKNKNIVTYDHSAKR